ncbi:MAG TPA: alpha/beta hydrolase-fold protein [Prolixibacteraceae bacterium]|jgi:enterochelin esterase family protein
MKLEKLLLSTFLLFGFIELHSQNSPTNSRSESTSQQDTIYSENFDHGARGWTFQDLWSESFWHTSTTGAYSNHSYWCGIEDLGGYDDLWEQPLTSPPISLTGTTAPVLTFMHNFRIKSSGDYYPSGFDSWDAVTVRISTDGINFNVIEPTSGKPYGLQSGRGFYYRYGIGLPGWAGNSGGWISSGFDLTAYAGQKVWIQFLFGSDDGYSTQDEAALFGWRIDNISIKDGTDMIFEDDAGDTGAAKFVTDSPAGPNPWHFTTTAFASPPISAGCFDTVSGNYFSGMKAALVSPAIAIKNLKPGTRKLTADFKYKGVFDQTKDVSGIFDYLHTESRIYSGGVWRYWQALSTDDFVPASFKGYNENNFFKLDNNGPIGADSIQFRCVVMTQADHTVKPPANLFIDDFVLYSISGYEGLRFGAFYDRIMSVPEQQRTAIADSFMLTVPSFPLVEEKTIVTYLYRGNANTVTVPGDANFWDTNGLPMTNIKGTNLWFAQSVFEPDSRLEYKFVINNGSWIVDPLNVHQFNGNSEIRMPDYLPPLETEYLSGIPHGTYKDSLFHSTVLGNSRSVRVYLPPMYKTAVNDSFPVVLFHDGFDYYDCSSANNILDNLISAISIKPVIAVFVPPVDRDNEYAFNKTSQFESFIINELMPVIDAKYRTLHDPGSRAMIGYSLGGVISTQICGDHPESFGLCAAFSPAYYPKGSEVERNFANSPTKNIKFYIDWGFYEPYFRPDAIIMRDILIAKGYNPVWHQWPEGHTCGNWRSHLDLALEYFFPTEYTGVEKIKTDQSTLKCYPNPSTGKITIEIIGQTNIQSLSVLDHNGQQIRTCKITQPGITLDISTLPNGVYFIKVTGEKGIQVKKFIKQE